MGTLFVHHHDEMQQAFDFAVVGAQTRLFEAMSEEERTFDGLRSSRAVICAYIACHAVRSFGSRP